MAVNPKHHVDNVEARQAEVRRTSAATPPTANNTNKQIEEWAKAHDIDLSGCDTKREMLERIDQTLAVV